MSGLATEPAFFSSVPGLANRAPTAQEHSQGGSHSLKKFCGRWGNVWEGGGVRQQGVVCEKEDRCQCWILFSGRQNCTVAILAQGTHWAVAVTQAFFAQARLPWLSFS